MKNGEEHDFFIRSRELIQELLDQNSSNLELDSKAAVQHYIDHDEYEMAFEGLFVDLMKLGKTISPKNPSAYIELGRKFGLDEDSAFDANFWGKFVYFMTVSKN